MKQKAEYRIGVGASSILMILVILALTAVSLLALSSAESNAALSSRSLTMTVDYYAAAAKAQETLTQMDALLNEHRTEYADGEMWTACLREQGLDYVTVVGSGEELSFRFSLDAGEDRTLEVSGALSPNGSPRCIVEAHRLSGHAAMGESDTLLLMQP